MDGSCRQGSLGWAVEGVGIWTGHAGRGVWDGPWREWGFGRVMQAGEFGMGRVADSTRLHTSQSTSYGDLDGSCRQEGGGQVMRCRQGEV